MEHIIFQFVFDIAPMAWHDFAESTNAVSCCGEAS